MICKILCMLSLLASVSSMVFFWDRMLTAKENSNRLLRYISFTANYIPLGIARVFTNSPVFMLAAYIFYFITTAAAHKHFYKESMLVKISAWVIMMGLTIVADGMIEVICYLGWGKTVAVDYSQPMPAALCFIVFIVAVLLFLIAARVWIRFYKKEKHPESVGAELLACVLSVCTLVAEILFLYHVGENTLSVYLLICGTFGLMTILIIFMLLIQSDRAAAQKELAEIHRQSELERAHYTSIEEKREALARIRHDYRNVLNAALILMRSGNLPKAEELLTEGAERINATSEQPFCAIPVINAVLAEKKTICDEQGILLRPELLLPETLPVDDFDLCIILGNLIDNAIRACGGKNEERSPDASPEIRLSAGVVQEYLVIKCENPVYPETEEKKGTGYGQKILKSLAEKYHGNFLAEKKDGSYTAQISLLCCPYCSC